MPYIESNEDVSKNETFKKALKIGAAVVGAAAIGQTVGKGIVSSAKGGKLKDMGASLMGDNSIINKMYSDGLDKTEKQLLKVGAFGSKEGATKLSNLGKSVGSDLSYKSDNGVIQAAAKGGAGIRQNIKDKATSGRFNKSIDALRERSGSYDFTMDDFISGSAKNDTVTKMGLMEEITNIAGKHGAGINKKETLNMVNSVYNSDANQKIRGALGIQTPEHEVEFANAMWGNKNAKTVGNYEEGLRGIVDQYKSI